MIRATLASLLLLLAPVAASAQTLLFSPNSLPLSGSCGTVTANAPCLDLTQTWNNAGITFYGFRLNVTNTASAGTSRLLDLQNSGSSQFNVSANGDLVANGITSVAAGSGLNAYLSIGNNVRLYGPAAQTLEQRTGVSAQTFNVYNTFTDTSNYERATLSWGANLLTIGTEHAGTGVGRALQFETAAIGRWTIQAAGHLIANTDNAYDIGASGANRPRNEFLAGYLVTQVTTVSGLTACASGLKGARSFVTDANATTFLSTVVGGGANNVPVVCDGTNWKIG